MDYPFDDADRFEFDHFPCNPCSVDDIDHVIHILVGIRDLLDKCCPAGALDHYAEIFKLTDNGTAFRSFPGLMAAHEPPCPMTCGAEGFLEPMFRSNEDVRASAHVPWDQNGLSHRTVGRGHFGMSRGKSAGCPFAMNTEVLFFSVDIMGFHFGHVMADVIDGIDTKIARAESEDLLEALPDPVGNDLPVYKSKIGCTGHGGQVFLSFVVSPRGHSIVGGQAARCRTFLKPEA
jgi:hypothetical protein